MTDITNHFLKFIQYPEEELKKSNVRIYALKSDDDPKNVSSILKKNREQKSNVRVYALKSDNDPKKVVQYPKEESRTEIQCPGLCFKKRR